MCDNDYTRSIEPRDFLQFWQVAKENVDVLGGSFSLQESGFKHPTHQCLELIYKGIDDATIYAKYLKHHSSTIKPSPTIFVFHGYGEASPPWFRLLSWASAGYSVIAMDVRGQLGRSLTGNGISGTNVHGQLMAGIGLDTDQLHFTKVYQDVYQLISIVSKMEEVDSDNLFTYGASQGGALSIVASVLSKKIKKTVAIHPFLSNFPLAISMGLVDSPYFEINKYFKFKDPSFISRDAVLEQLSYIDVQHFAKYLDNSFLGALTMKDNICPPETQLSTFNNINCQREILTYPEHSHEDIKCFEDIAFSFFMN